MNVDCVDAFNPCRGRDPNTPGWVQHIAFRVKDRATLLEFKQRLQANGVQVLGVTDHGMFDQNASKQ